VQPIAEAPRRLDDFQKFLSRPAPRGAGYCKVGARCESPNRPPARGQACAFRSAARYKYGPLPPVFGWERNEYDRLGHFLQGFVPAIIARELFLRFNILAREKWLPFFVLSICLAISASYELLEWLAATMSGTAANDFIGSQGDVWDTQADMLMALIGAICALVLFSHLHDRALRKLERVEGAAP
jgi:hypothetical protein